MKGKIPGEYPSGIIIETRNENHNTREQVTMKVAEIKKNHTITFAMADYTIMSFGSNSIQK